MIGRLMVLQEVDRSIKQIKFILNLYQKEKQALTLIIYQNRREEISVLKPFQYKLIGKRTSGNQSRTSNLHAFNLNKTDILSSGKGLTLSSIYTHFNKLKKNAFGKQCGKR